MYFVVVVNCYEFLALDMLWRGWKWDGEGRAGWTVDCVVGRVGTMAMQEPTHLQHSCVSERKRTRIPAKQVLCFNNLCFWYVFDICHVFPHVWILMFSVACLIVFEVLFHVRPDVCDF